MLCYERREEEHSRMPMCFVTKEGKRNILECRHSFLFHSQLEPLHDWPISDITWPDNGQLESLNHWPMSDITWPDVQNEQIGCVCQTGRTLTSPVHLYQTAKSIFHFSRQKPISLWQQQGSLLVQVLYSYCSMLSQTRPDQTRPDLRGKELRQFNPPPHHTHTFIFSP